MDTQAKIEIARELGFDVGTWVRHPKMPGRVASLLPSTGTPEERLCALIDNIEAALTFPDGRLKIMRAVSTWEIGYTMEPTKEVREATLHSYASRLEATVAALELADALAAVPKNRWGLKADDAVVYFPAALELAVSRCGGEYYEEAWWLETKNRPGEVELADLSARLDAQLRAGDIVFDAVEHEGRWYVQRDSGFSTIAAKVYNRHGEPVPWFHRVTPKPNYTKSYGTELEALVAALGYAEECRSLQAADVVEGFHVVQCASTKRWALARTDYEHGEHRGLGDSNCWRWLIASGRDCGIGQTLAGDVTKYPVMHFATREGAVAHRDELVRLVSSEPGRPFEDELRKKMTESIAAQMRKACQVSFKVQVDGGEVQTISVNAPKEEHKTMIKIGEFEVRCHIGGAGFFVYSAVDDDRLRTAAPFYWNDLKNNTAPSFFSTEEAATYAARLLDSEWRRINETNEPEANMTANTTALATITELALPGLLRGALITVQRELVELAIPVVRRVARVEIKAWHRFAAAFSPKLKARLQLDRQIANLVVSVLVPCALYEAACRIEWIRKSENVMTFLRASIDAGCTEAGRLLAEPGLAFAKDGLTMLTRAVKEEKRRGELRAASSRLLEDMTGRDRRVVAEAEREVVELARSLGGVG